jgi:HTH-type transcriptional regulator/antitoxin HigA
MVATSYQIEHPGVFILEEMEAREWNQTDLAYILDMSVQQLNKILNGKVSVSMDMAASLGEAFDVPAEFFANLQKQHDLQKAKQPEPGIRTRATWLANYPIREMIDRGWIEKTEAGLLDLQMMRFFDTDSIENIPFFGGQAIAHAAKKTSYDEPIGSQLVWLHRVRGIAGTMAAPLYDPAKLKDALHHVRAHMFDLDDFGEIPALLLDCGVRTVFVEHLPGSKIDGVCTWLGDQPVIGLSLRLNRPDNLCFVLRHEIEHVLNEDGKDKPAGYSHVDVFEPDRNTDLMPDEEKIADAAAAEFLIPQDKLASFISRKGKWISETDVLAFSARHHIHPAVVIGQIQHHRHKDGDERAFAFLRKYMTKVHERFFDWEFRDGWGKVAHVGL